MISNHLFFAVFSTAIRTSVATEVILFPAPQYQTFSFQGHYYYFVSTLVRYWQEAAGNCKYIHFSPGGGYGSGSILTINNPDEMGFIQATSNSIQGKPGALPGLNYWVGGSRVNPTASFTWYATNTLLSNQASYWGPGQPDNYMGFGQNCVQLSGQTGANYSLDDTQCDAGAYPNAYVCKSNQIPGAMQAQHANYLYTIPSNMSTGVTTSPTNPPSTICSTGGYGYPTDITSNDEFNFIRAWLMATGYGSNFWLNCLSSNGFYWQTGDKTVALSYYSPWWASNTGYVQLNCINCCVVMPSYTNYYFYAVQCTQVGYTICKGPLVKEYSLISGGEATE